MNEDILAIYGISQDPDTKEYVMVLEYAEGGNFSNWIKKDGNWMRDMDALKSIIKGLGNIHEKNMVHRDFHIGNILLKHDIISRTCISDMGLCGEVSNVGTTNIYGVMPYVAPEVLKGNPYTQAADMYSFGMVMYFVATGRQPFDGRAHDQVLALNICNGIRPEISEKDAPKCYIDLVNKCWDPNPDNRPNATEILKSIELFIYSGKEIIGQFEEAYKYRKANLSLIENNQLNTHPQAIYTSRLLNTYTTSLVNFDLRDYNDK
jgi:serine/threonine protein kinase